MQSDLLGGLSDLNFGNEEKKDQEEEPEQAQTRTEKVKEFFAEEQKARDGWDQAQM